MRLNLKIFTALSLFVVVAWGSIIGSADQIVNVIDDLDETAAIVESSRTTSSHLRISDSGHVEKRIQYLPVVIVHGMGDSCAHPGMTAVRLLISKMLNDTYVKCVMLGETYIEDVVNAYSLTMNAQTDVFAEAVNNDPKLQFGFQGIGFSQGNLILRAYVQKYGWQADYPSMKTLVSIHGPMLGVATLPHCKVGKDTGVLEKYFCELLDGVTSEFAYTKEIQQNLAQSNYFRNPYFIKEYLTTDFLPPLNFEKVVYTPNGTKIEIRALDILDTLVLVKAQDDTMVIPAESEWFGFFKDNSFDQIIPYPATQFFEPLGLKKLGREGKLHFETTTGDHLQFSRSELARLITKYLMFEVGKIKEDHSSSERPNTFSEEQLALV